MRLNCVESFYAFLLRFRSEGSEEDGRPAMANPHVGSATHDQADCKGQSTTAKAPCKGSAYGRRHHPRSGRKGQPPAARPQVAAARYKATWGSPAARATTCKDGRWQERPPARAALARGGAASPRGAARRLQRLPTPKACSATTCAGQRRRRRRR
ncbi:hypothetical protein BHE74_00058914 [Ensete ventricosum]|nr:hypothetical protein GW17_00019122 [Ensete ventricosum]RWW36089.1 hypothetical protein BHE74_00058914 [Ensete ventricosum]